jgi:hypothetical protein
LAILPWLALECCFHRQECLDSQEWSNSLWVELDKFQDFTLEVILEQVSRFSIQL